jgi:deoxyribodipyrimidine photo-lyase
MQINIWWIRRDFRLHDNPALHAALENADAILPIFILDPDFDSMDTVGEKRCGFLYANLHSLEHELNHRGGRLIVRKGAPLQVLQDVFTETRAKTIFAQEDISPYATQRDASIANRLPLVLTGGLTIHPPAAIRKANGNPYTVFTPYSKVWKSHPLPSSTSLLEAPGKIPVPEEVGSLPLPFEPSHSKQSPFPPGEKEAQKRLSAFIKGHQAPIYTYHEGRNRMDLEGTSMLSPYLRFGIISGRQVVQAAVAAQEDAQTDEGRKGSQTWLNELIWREFFISILYNFPSVRQHSFRKDMRSIAWQNDQGDFQAWTHGQTGYPIVDAAMRQLLEIGWMHNRARMIVASFLVKDLLIDWRWGERWFMQQLVDGDPAANNGGWQWTAGTGTDAAPYFRIFNPILQSKKFDPNGDYIRRWVPELSSLPTKVIHTPWELSESKQRELGLRIGKTYPAPIIDHGFARQRTLNVFKQAKTS